MEIGERIKKIRKEKGKTTYDLAKLTGLSQSVISKLENGKRKADNDILNQLAEALNVSTDRLTGESASCIIENQINELGVSLEDIAKKAAVLPQWLQNIENLVPDNWDYEAITRVAEVIGVPAGILRAALARQEAPAYEGPRISAEEAFKDAQEDFKEPYEPYYLNDETRQIAQEAFENPELRSLFSVARDIPPERLKAHLNYLEGLKKLEKGENDEGC